MKEWRQGRKKMCHRENAVGETRKKVEKKEEYEVL
jgi:hypothetical protein